MPSRRTWGLAWPSRHIAGGLWDHRAATDGVTLLRDDPFGATGLWEPVAPKLSFRKALAIITGQVPRNSGEMPTFTRSGEHEFDCGHYLSPCGICQSAGLPVGGWQCWCGARPVWGSRMFYGGGASVRRGTFMIE